ncbi:MAG: NifU family protein [Mycoplasmataceae bacterium]|jgi:Fe-S cluster biogenesis protein NfuA|nr:NifU family protein [Mycoplasmataceae bacterium]
MTKEEKIEKIKKVIKKLRVYLEDDGGDMELSSFSSKDNELIIRIKGACVNCPYIEQTFDKNIKELLLLEIPFLKKVTFIY